MPEFIKPPKIDAPTVQEQVKQLEMYLFQLSVQLNYIFSTLDQKEGEPNGKL